MEELNNIKIIITGFDRDFNNELAQKIVEIDDNLSITPKFTTNKAFINNTNQTLDYYISLNNVYLAYKNNSLLYVNTDIDNISTGITNDDFINNDICVIDIKDFNMISDKTLLENEIIVVWIDSKSKGNESFNEIKYLQDRLQNYKYMYFYKEEIRTIAQILIDYLEAPKELKIEILENNS